MTSVWSTTLGTPSTPVRAGGLRRPLALVLAFVLALGAGMGVGVGAAASAEPPAPAGTDRPTSPPAEPELVPAAHAAAIAEYWDQRAAAFDRGPADGVTFVAERLHPSLGYSADRCRDAWYPHGLPERLHQDVTLREATVAPAPDWRMPYGPLHDAELASPVYRMHVQAVLTGLDSGVDVDQTVAVHLAVIDGRAHGFAACVEPTVARSIINDLTAPPSEAPSPPAPSPPPDSVPAPAPDSVPAPAPDPVPAPAPDPVPAPAPDPVPAPPPAPAPDPVPAPTPPPIPQLPPPVYPTPAPLPPDLELTLEEELRLVLSLIDGLLHAGWLTVDEAIELLLALAAAPELDEHQRALVEDNVELLRDHQDDPDSDLPRLQLAVDPPEGDASAQARRDDPAPERYPGLYLDPARDPDEPLDPVGCAVEIDVLEPHRQAVCD